MTASITGVLPASITDVLLSRDERMPWSEAVCGTIVLLTHRPDKPLKPEGQNVVSFLHRNEPHQYGHTASQIGKPGCGMVGNFTVDNGHFARRCRVFNGLSLDSFTPHQIERDAMSLTERLKQYAAIPDQMDRAIRGIAVLVMIAGLIALLALGVSVVALERSHAH